MPQFLVRETIWLWWIRRASAFRCREIDFRFSSEIRRIRPGRCKTWMALQRRRTMSVALRRHLPRIDRTRLSSPMVAADAAVGLVARYIVFADAHVLYRGICKFTQSQQQLCFGWLIAFRCPIHFSRLLADNGALTAFCTRGLAKRSRMLTLNSNIFMLRYAFKIWLQWCVKINQCYMTSLITYRCRHILKSQLIVRPIAFCVAWRRQSFTRVMTIGLRSLRRSKLK